MKKHKYSLFLSKKKNNKAFGLVEALIAIIFVASTMILAVKVVAKGLQISKQNETRDQAAGIMLRALEYNQLDLPSKVMSDLVSDDPSTPVSVCYKLDEDEAEGISLSEVAGTCSPYSDRMEMDCEPDSVYALSLDGVLVCNRVIFTNVPAGVTSDSLDVTIPDKIRINSTVAYNLDGQTIVESVDTYRKVR
jgi:competence protein ComGC